MAIVLYTKKYGETLARMRERFLREHKEFEDEKITYAGRLDPLASGLIPILTGADVHKKESYLNCDKTYRMDFVLGLSTDTGDVLGMLSSLCFNEVDISDDLVVEPYLGKQQQTYPVFSSKTVEGKPLWLWAREGGLDERKIPKREVELFSLKQVGKEVVTKEDFAKKVFDAISLVHGDFRQQEIYEKWEEYFRVSTRDSFCIYRVEARVSSGFYMRSLAEKIGKAYGCGGVSLHIERIAFGDRAL